MFQFKFANLWNAKKAAWFLLPPMVFYFAGAKTLIRLEEKVAGAAVFRGIFRLFRRKSPFSWTEKFSLFQKSWKQRYFREITKRWPFSINSQPFELERIFRISETRSTSLCPKGPKNMKSAGASFHIASVVLHKTPFQMIHLLYSFYIRNEKSEFSCLQYIPVAIILLPKR